MKRVFTLLFIVISVICSASAELAQLDDGYYRIQCVETGRYISFCNNYVDEESFLRSTESQFWPLRTISGFENVVNDPGSVIYLKKHEQGWALCSQDYDFDFFGSFFQITDMGDGSYRLWATYSKSGVTVTRYMRDCDDSSGGFSYVTTQESISKGWNWRLIPVNSDDQKYIGLVPEVKVGGKGYATFYAGIPYKLGSGMKAYAVDTETDETCTLKDIGSEIPAKTPVVIACAGDNASDNKLTPLESSSASVGTNYLKGVMFCYPVTYYNQGKIVEDRANPYWNTVDHDVLTMRVLGEEDGKLVFKKGSEDLDYMPANKAYLNVTSSSAATLSSTGTTFTAKTTENIDMVFTILDESAKTCQVGYLDGSEDKPAVNREATGSVTIPKTVNDYTVVQIGQYAFYECSGLTSISIPNSVTTVEACAFTRCSGLTTLTIPNSVTTIKGGGFFQCSGLTSLTIPKSVTSIEHEAFSYCYGLTSLNVEAGNTKYDSRDNCNAIIETATNKLVSGTKNTVIPNSVTTIGNEAFLGCRGLTSITIPNSVTTIEDGAFHGCYALVSIKIPKSVTTIGILPFVDCHNLNSLNVEAGNTKYDSRDNCNAVIETSTNAIVAACSTTTIPTTVTEIGSYVFCGLYNCTIHLHSDIDKIGDYAFWNCNGLILDVEKTTPLTINENVFEGLSNSTLKVPAGSKSAYAEAAGWNKFSTILESTFTAQTTEGWDMVFTILDETKKTCQVGYLDGSFDKTAVDKNTVNGAVTIPNTANGYTVVKIGKCALQSVNGMTSVTIPNTVTSIDEYAFADCQGLTSFVLPASVTSLGSLALYDLKNVTSLSVAEGNTIFDSRNNCNAIIETSTNKLLAGCKTTKIPADVIEIGSDALCLQDCSFFVPSTITKINEYGFSNCRNLILQVAHTTPLEINENVFNHLSNSTLRVPAGCKSAYAEATGWSKFGADNIIEENKVTLEDVEAGHLADKISDEDKFNITDLTITGRLNGTDFRLLRAMAGNDYQGQPTEGKLQKLDLSGVNIVEGGDNYLDTNEGITLSNGGSVPNSYHWGTNNNSLGSDLFIGCDKLEEIVLPNSITSIGGGAFAHCNNLKSLIIPENVSSIGLELILNCNISSLSVAAGNQTFSSPEGSNVLMQGTKLVYGCKTSNIPSTTTVIGDGAFKTCANLGEVTIPEGVTTIERYAFLYSGLTAINLPSTLETIGDNAFAECSNLTSVTVGTETPLEITANVFTNRANATLNVPADSKAAYQAANYWKEFKEIVEVEAPSGNIVFASPEVKAACVAKWDTNSDGELSYAEAAAVTSLVDPTDIEDPFALLTDVESDFTFDEFQYFTGVTSLTNYDFDEFEHLTSIVLPNSIQSIEDGAFYDCKLTSIHIPASVTDISDTYINESVIEVLYTPAFNSSFLQTITVDPGNTRYSSPTGSNVIIDKTSNTLIMGCRNTDFSKIPNTVTTIAMRAFEGVEFANPAVNLPTSVEAIKAYAFNYSNIISINLGELTRLTEIGLTAFKDCDGLTEVTLPASITTMERAIFAGCDNIIKVVSNREEPLANNNNNFDPDHIIAIYNNAVLYVPSGKVEAYTNAGWEEPFDDDLKSFRVITDGDHTDPEAIEGLAYNGSDQKLILPGTYRTGMMEYSLDGSTYSTSVPTGKEAGEYTVYYRKVGESVASTLTATIALSGNIVFASPEVKAACVAKWDTNRDDELSYAEARAVTCLIEDPRNSDDPFMQLSGEDSEFSFDEFQYFTGVTSLTGYEFADCENLTSIILPNSITSIGEGAFSRCKKLTSIHIPASVTYIHTGDEEGDEETVPAFISEYLQTITVDPENTKYASPEGSNVIINTETNTLILGCGNTDFTKIPNTVTTIGQDAFAGVTFANTIVSLPTSVTGIMEYAFMHSNITSINLGELSNLTTIGNEAFSYCKGLTEVTLPASITRKRTNEDEEGIGISVFANCDNIVKVVSNIAVPLDNSGDNSIIAIQNDAVLYVPEGKVKDYIDNGWEEIDNYLKIQSFRVITDGDYTAPKAIVGLVYNGSNQKLILPGTYRIGMMEYSLDGTTYSTSVPLGKDAGEYTVYYRKVGESVASNLTVTIAAPQTISVFSGSNLWAGYVATEDLALPTGLEAYVITNLGATTATASSLNYIPQGVPVLLKRNNASVNDYEISTGSGTAPTVNLLKTYDSDKSVSNREGFILYNDEFVLVNEGTLPAGRLFLPANGSGRALTRTIVFDRDDIVDFGDSQENNDDSNQWYDIQGRKLERKPTKKGIYILDGRKVVIK